MFSREFSPGKILICDGLRGRYEHHLRKERECVHCDALTAVFVHQRE